MKNTKHLHCLLEDRNSIFEEISFNKNKIKKCEQKLKEVEVKIKEIEAEIERLKA
jgi:peptidoglycan hydrolase CwlO-like protein